MTLKLDEGRLAVAVEDVDRGVLGAGGDQLVVVAAETRMDQVKTLLVPPKPPHLEMK